MKNVWFDTKNKHKILTINNKICIFGKIDNRGKKFGEMDNQGNGCRGNGFGGMVIGETDSGE